jgi:hypothetical protein
MRELEHVSLLSPSGPAEIFTDETDRHFTSRIAVYRITMDPRKLLRPRRFIEPALTR